MITLSRGFIDDSAAGFIAYFTDGFTDKIPHVAVSLLVTLAVSLKIPLAGSMVILLMTSLVVSLMLVFHCCRWFY